MLRSIKTRTHCVGLYQPNQLDQLGSYREVNTMALCFEQFQVLEQRLVLHEENALKKYADLDAKLASDTRLKALNA